jgi:hypothetical protein
MNKERMLSPHHSEPAWWGHTPFVQNDENDTPGSVVKDFSSFCTNFCAGSPGDAATRAKHQKRCRTFLLLKVCAYCTIGFSLNFLCAIWRINNAWLSTHLML